MSSATERLSFMASLIDKVSGPARGVISEIKKMQDQASKGFSNITQGAMGMAGAGASLYGIISPAREVSKALGEVKSLGVTTEELQALEKSALSFTRTYGGAAADFIKSGYDIQSAISGLNNGELAKFTEASNILAKGTKADAATITSYMGTMYGIFEKDATKMGKAQWVEMLTGQTAAAANMFKTDGKGMSEAFSALGASAQAHGIQISEQMAVLGDMQATMGGSGAATKYKAFLNGVGQAQAQLGLSFVDSQGKMLPMADILEKIKGKFGDIDKVSESDAIKKAFGSDEAVDLVKFMIGRTSALKNNIEAIAGVSGMDATKKMAADMTDVWDSLGGSVSVARIQFGQLIAPILNPLVNKLSGIIGATSVWLEQHKTLGMVLGVVTLAVIGITAAVSAFAIGAGIAQIVMVAWTAAGSAYTAVQWAMNAAMAANPVGLVVIGVIALIAAIVALIANWGKLRTWLMDSTLGKFFLLTFAPLIVIFYAIRFVVGLIIVAFSGLVALIGVVWGYLKETAFVQALIEKFTMLGDLIKTIWGGIAAFGQGIFNGLVGVFDWILKVGDEVMAGLQDLLNGLSHLPGLGWLKDVNLTSKTESIMTAAKPIPPASPAKAVLPAGGLKNSVTSTNTKIANMGGVNIYTSAPPNRAFLEEMAHLQTGFS